MKLANIFIGLINIATMVVAADVAGESTNLRKYLHENDLPPHRLVHIFCRQQFLKNIKDEVDPRLTFDFHKYVSEKRDCFALGIIGAPKSVQAVENILKTWVNSLIVLERQVPFSRAKWEHLRLVQQNEHTNKDSRLSMHLLEKKQEQLEKKQEKLIVIYVITMPGNEEQAREILERLVSDYHEEVITCAPEKLDECSADIAQKRQDLLRDNITVCMDRPASTFYVAGTNSQFAVWAAVIKDLVERKSTAKEKEERAHQMKNAAEKVPTEQESTGSTHYVLVQNHRDVSFGDVATALGRKLSVRVEKIKKSEAHPGYLVVPFPKSHYVAPAIALKNLIIDRYGSEISLQILDPRNLDNLKGIVGSKIPEKKIPKDEQVNDRDRYEPPSPDAVVRPLAPSF